MSYRPAFTGIGIIAGYIAIVVAPGVPILYLFLLRLFARGRTPRRAEARRPSPAHEAAT
jgi:hypothetical protein